MGHVESSKQNNSIVASLWQWQTLAILLIVAGAVIISLYGLRSLHSFREFQYIREQGLDRGTARIEAIRPWMTVRYVAVAYAVPEEYLFAQLDIPYNRRNSNEILGRLNDEYEMGLSDDGSTPRIVELMAQAIRDYRANPVPTGLHQIRPWMTLRYIASSTGVPTTYLLAQIGIETAHAREIDATVRPLDQLSAEIKFPGGPEAFIQTLQEAVDAFDATDGAK